jgi:hypothetical protein
LNDIFTNEMTPYLTPFTYDVSTYAPPNYAMETTYSFQIDLYQQSDEFADLLNAHMPAYMNTAKADAKEWAFAHLPELSAAAAVAVAAAGYATAELMEKGYLKPFDFELPEYTFKTTLPFTDVPVEVANVMKVYVNAPTQTTLFPTIDASHRFEAVMKFSEFLEIAPSLEVEMNLKRPVPRPGIGVTIRY